jgi:hypothetical protein
MKRFAEAFAVFLGLTFLTNISAWSVELDYPYKRPGSVRMSGDRQAYFRDCMAKDGNVPAPASAKP